MKRRSREKRKGRKGKRRRGGGCKAMPLLSSCSSPDTIKHKLASFTGQDATETVTENHHCG